MAKPTASASGTNSALAAPIMKKAGMKTARMQSMASRRGSVVSRVPSSAARASDLPRARWVWMFSTVTVASSTRMPTASARPPRVMRWMFCPLIHRPNAAAMSDSGMLMTTMKAVRRSRRKTSTMRPVSTAPSAPSFTRSRMLWFTTGVWSNSKLTLMPSGSSF